MDEHDLSRRLRDAAASPSRELDQTVIDRGVVRRRRRRHTAAGAAAAALVLVAGLAVFALFGDDGDRGLQFVDTPTTSTTEPLDGDVVVPTQLSAVELWELQGRYLVYGSNGISWLVDGHLEPVWNEPVSAAYSDGAGGIVFQTRQQAPPWGPMGSIHRLRSGSAAPVELVADGKLAQLRGLATIGGEVHVLYTRWLPDPGTEADERDGTPDSGMHLELFALSPMTGSEHSLGAAGGFDTSLSGLAETSDGLLFQSCHVECVIHRELGVDLGDPRHQVVGWSRTWGIAVGGGRLATITTVPDAETERLELQLRSLDGEILRSIRVPDHRTASVAVHPELSPDGASAILASFDEHERASIVLALGLDTDEPTIQRVLTDQALRFAPDAPTPGQGPPPIQVHAEEVDLDDLEGRFLVFGDEGIAWLENGELSWVWTEPVEEAHPDGSGGVVFQDVGTGEWPDAVSGAIRWLPADSSTPVPLVAAGTRTTLRLVAPLNGELTLLVTRWTGARNLDEGRELLVAIPLSGEPERVLDETGHWGDTGLDGVALTDVGLVTSVCHLQCSLRRLVPGSDDVVVQWADWSSGLAGRGLVLGFVAYLSPIGPDGYPGDPVLRLIEADSQPSELERRDSPLIDVRLPHTPGAGWRWVDLAPGARSAVVVTPRSDPGESPHFDVVLVTALDTAEPRVQVVRTDHALRFG